MLKFFAYIFLVSGNTAFAGPSSNVSQAEFVSPEQIKFDEILPGAVQFGTVFGDRESGEHGTFVRIKKGESTPLHTHSAGYQAIVIQGIFENPVPGIADSQKPLKQGSYDSIHFEPGREKHTWS